MSIKALTKHEAVRAALRKDISGGKYAQGKRIPAEPELSAKYGVNRLTVNRAVNELIRESLLCRLPGKGTFVTNRFAETRKRGEDVVIHFFVTTLENHYYSTLVHHATDAVEQAEGMSIRIHNTRFEEERERDTIRQLLQDDRNIIFMSRFIAPDTRVMIMENPDRFVIFGPAPELIGKAHLIFTDARAGGFIATAHLLGNGHRRIAFLGGTDVGTPAIPSKYAGYCQALKEAGIEPDARLARDVGGYERMGSDEKRQTIRQCFEFFGAASAPPTAVFCSCDDIAFRYIMICHEHGLKVPGDISVCGYDGCGGEPFDALRLTTVRQPYEMLMQEALSVIRDVTPGQRAFKQIAPALAAGATTGRPSGPDATHH